MKNSLILMFITVFTLAACAPTQDTVPVNNNQSTTTDSTPTVEYTGAQSAAYTAPSFGRVRLTNAITGESFSFADFAGKTVFIEPMATWCTNCLAQQGIVRSVVNSLNRDDVVFISLSVEPGLPNSDLADYATRNNFPWIFAVSTDGLTEALVNQFGRAITNPPSTPHFFIGPDGTLSPLSTGQHDSSSLLDQINAISG